MRLFLTIAIALAVSSTMLGQANDNFVRDSKQMISEINHGNVDTVRVLLDHGFIDPNEVRGPNSQNYTWPMIAIRAPIPEQTQEQIISLFLAKGTRLSATNPDDLTRRELTSWVLEGHQGVDLYNILKYLLDHHADATNGGSLPFPPLIIVIARSTDSDDQARFDFLMSVYQLLVDHDQVPSNRRAADAIRILTFHAVTNAYLNRPPVEFNGILKLINVIFKTSRKPERLAQTLNSPDECGTVLASHLHFNNVYKQGGPVCTGEESTSTPDLTHAKMTQLRALLFSLGVVDIPIAPTYPCPVPCPYSWSKMANIFVR